MALRRKSLLVTLLGTGNSFAMRNTSIKKVRMDVLSAQHIAVTGSTESQVEGSVLQGPNFRARVFDGIDTMAHQRYTKAAETIEYFIGQLIDGVTLIHINGHSRGAVGAIFNANILYQLQHIVNDLDIESIDTIEYTDLFKDLKNTDFKTEIIKLFENKSITKDELKLLKNSLNQLEINIFAIDPVPGNDFFDHGPKRMIWDDAEIYTIPPIVKNYHQVTFENELSQCFNILIPQAINPSVTNITLYFSSGNHCISSGMLTVQKPKLDEGLVPPIGIQQSNGIKIFYDTSAVPDLVLCMSVDFMQHSGITELNPSMIDEKIDYHAEWKKLGLIPIKQVLANFIYAKANGCEDQFMLNIYNRIQTAAPAFKYLEHKLYPTGPRTVSGQIKAALQLVGLGGIFGATNSHLPRYASMLNTRGEVITTDIRRILPSDPDTIFVDIRHRELQAQSMQQHEAQWLRQMLESPHSIYSSHISSILLERILSHFYQQSENLDSVMYAAGDVKSTYPESPELCRYFMTQRLYQMATTGERKEAIGTHPRVEELDDLSGLTPVI